MNTRIWQWFERGHIAEALLGGEPYFVADTTFRDRHDRPLIIDQLLLWAAAHEQLGTAAEAFMAALRTAVSDSDVWAAYDLVWSYLIVTRDQAAELPVRGEEVLGLLDEVDRRVNEQPRHVATIRNEVRAALTEIR